MPDSLPSLSILDVGHGNSAVIRDGEATAIIDAGPGSALLEFLSQTGVRRVDLVLLSHADGDHIDGLVGLLASEAVTIERVHLNADALKGSQVWKDLVYTLEKRHTTGKTVVSTSLTCSENGRLDLPSVAIEVLAPRIGIAATGPGATDARGRKITTNTASAVIRLKSHGRAVALFMGDIDQVGLENLTETVNDATAEVLVFPHHGGHPASADPTKFTELICDLVKPGIVVFSIGRGRHGTPLPAIVSALRRLSPQSRILCTQLSGNCANIVPLADPTHLHPAFARGRDKRSCCAGTIHFSLGPGALTVAPSLSSHLEFIAKSAPTALCRKS